MEQKYKNEYKVLLTKRIELNKNIIKDKKMKILDFFKSMSVNITNLEKNTILNIALYRAPLFDICRSNMLFWPTESGKEIYIDQNLLVDRSNNKILNHKMTNEVIDLLSKFYDEPKIFGHVYTKENNILIGINEAVKQIFTDDIEKNSLKESDDYLYFIKNILRIYKNIIGKEKLASQFLNNDISFEEEFNKITNNKFNDFAYFINNLYLSSKKEYYHNLSEEEIVTFKSDKLEIINFTLKVIAINMRKNPQTLKEIQEDFIDKEFLIVMGLVKPKSIEII